MLFSIFTIFLFALIGFVLPNEKIYDIILGWSTGHVGTTSLCDPSIFKSTNFVSIAHELKPDPSIQFNKENWQVSTYLDEYNFVNNTYIPTILSFRGD